MSEKPTYEELEKRIKELELAKLSHSRAEEQLNLFKRVVDIATDAIGISTPKGLHWYQNPSFDALFGEIGEDPPSSVYCDENIGRDIFKTIMSGDEWSGEVQMYAKDGSVLDIFLRAYAFTDENGQILGLVGIHTNITKRKQVEKALQKGEAKMSSIFRAAPVGIGLVSNRMILDVNKRLCEITGYRADEMIGNNARFLYPSDADYEYVGVEKYRQIESKGTGTVETRFLRKDGEVINVLMSSTPLDMTDLGAGVTFIVLDITERKQAEEALQQSESFLENIVENIPNMIFVKDAKELRFVRFNKAGEELLGYPREELIGKNDYDFFPREEAAFFTEKDRNVLKSGKLLDIPEEPILTKQKGARILHTKKMPIFDKEGTPKYLLGISEDITESKRLEEQLIQTQKMESIGNLAGGIAHDFNNILFPIIGMSELLIEDLSPGSSEHLSVQEILKAGKRGRDLVKQILALSRQSEHKMMPVRVQQILKEVLKLTRSTIPTDIEIIQDIQTDCGFVMADPTQLHQIAMNLITNAYHAVETTGGSISIKIVEAECDRENLSSTSFEPGRYAILSVSDTGTGIDPAIMDKIFEPYFTTKKQDKGTGLGLSVVYGLVKEHGGEIEVDSEIGKGTTFNVYLPLIAKQVEQVPAEKLDIDPTGTERILLIDDEETIVMVIKKVLERLGYHVVERTSSPDALKAFKENPSTFDLVISDMTMPNMTGDQLALELIAIRPDIPIIICTGFSERIDKEKAADIGIKGFIMKPIVRSELAKMVRKVLDESKSEYQK